MDLNTETSLDYFLQPQNQACILAGNKTKVCSASCAPALEVASAASWPGNKREIKLQVTVSGSVISKFPCSKCLKAYTCIYHIALPPAVASQSPHTSFITNPPGRNHLPDTSNFTKSWAPHCVFVCSMSPRSPTAHRLPQNVRKKKRQGNRKG